MLSETQRMYVMSWYKLVSTSLQGSFFFFQFKNYAFVLNRELNSPSLRES